MKFRINGEHIGYISDELIKKYRFVCKDDIESDHEMIKNIVNVDIFVRESSERITAFDIQELKELARYHCFESVGQYIEFIILSRINNKLMVCRKCTKLRHLDGAKDYCPVEDCLVYANDCACDLKTKIDEAEMEPSEDENRALDIANGFSPNTRIVTYKGQEYSVKEDSIKEFEKVCLYPFTSEIIGAIEKEYGNATNLDKKVVDIAQKIINKELNCNLNTKELEILDVKVDIDENGNIVEIPLR